MEDYGNPAGLGFSLSPQQNYHYNWPRCPDTELLWVGRESPRYWPAGWFLSSPGWGPERIKRCRFYGFFPLSRCCTCSLQTSVPTAIRCEMFTSTAHVWIVCVYFFLISKTHCPTAADRCEIISPPQFLLIFISTDNGDSWQCKPVFWLTVIRVLGTASFRTEAQVTHWVRFTAVTV